MSSEASQRFAALLKRTGGHAVMDLTFPRPMARLNNVLVLS